MAADALRQWLADQLRQWDVELSGEQADRFETYYRLLIEWNEKMNLTGITARDAVYEKHFYDSATVAAAAPVREANCLIDVGSGAGFPSIPLKIVFPHLQVTIVDALAKRIRFLETVVETLGLDGVTCIHARAEDLGRSPEHRDRYDLVTARAVARLASLNELCLPFARRDGLFVAMKGADVEAEVQESRHSLAELRARLRDVVRLQLPIEQAERRLVVIEKIGPTPAAYPRKAGIPLKSPLMGKQSAGIRI